MTTLVQFDSAKKKSPARAAMRKLLARLRHGGAVLLFGLREQRRREAARIIAHERHLAGLSRVVRPEADAWDRRPKIVPLRKAPAMRPATDPLEGWQPGGWP